MILAIVGAAVFIAIFAIIMLLSTQIYKAEPNEALIFTGKKYKYTIQDEKTGETKKVSRGWKAVIGGRALKIPVLETVSKISLKTINLPDVQVCDAYSKEGVPVTIDAVANVKVSSGDELLARAVERFLRVDDNEIKRIIKETLEGQLRDIIGTLTVEELYQERDKFANEIITQAGLELAKIGIEIDIITIQNINDKQGYLAALGVKRTADVKKNAIIGQAEADREAMQKAETAKREGAVVKAEQERQTAEAEKNRDAAKEEYTGQIAAAAKKAAQAGPKAEAIALQEVVKEQQKVEEEKQLARKKVEFANAEAQKEKYRAEKIVPADAEKTAIILNAEGEKQAAILKAEGEAQAILLKGTKEAEVIQLKLEAEAEGLKKKAEAWEKYGEAAKMNLALEAITNIAKSLAPAIEKMKFDKVIAFDSGSKDGSSALSRTMNAAPAALAQLIDQLEAATGINLKKILNPVTTNTPASNKEIIKT